jgi:hypothetical protein
MCPTIFCARVEPVQSCRLLRLLFTLGLSESVMRAKWNKAWKATVLPVVLLSSAALGQTRGAWVDPPADLFAPAAQESEPSPPVQATPPQIETPSVPLVAAPESEAQPISSLSALRLKPEGQKERYSVGRLVQQGQVAPSQAVPRLQNSQTASEPAVAPTSTSRAAGRPNRVRSRPSSRQQDAQRLAIGYLNLWSTSNRQALQTTPQFYSSRVQFHGKRMSFGELLVEKRRFAQRWPDRDYRYRPDTMNMRCSPDRNTCTVQSTFDFVAANSKLDRRSRGVGTHELVVSFAGERPVIVSESSRVLSRGRRQ